MAKLWTLFLLGSCLAQAISAHFRIARNAERELNERDWTQIRYGNITVEDYRRILALSAEVEKWTPQVINDLVNQACEILNSDLKASAVNLTSAQQVYLAGFVERVMRTMDDKDKIRFLVSEFAMMDKSSLNDHCVAFRDQRSAIMCTIPKRMKMPPKRGVLLSINIIVSRLCAPPDLRK